MFVTIDGKNIPVDHLLLYSKSACKSFYSLSSKQYARLLKQLEKYGLQPINRDRDRSATMYIPDSAPSSSLNPAPETRGNQSLCDRRFFNPAMPHPAPIRFNESNINLANDDRLCNRQFDIVKGRPVMGYAGNQ